MYRQSYTPWGCLDNSSAKFASGKLKVALAGSAAPFATHRTISVLTRPKARCNITRTLTEGAATAQVQSSPGTKAVHA